MIEERIVEALRGLSQAIEAADADGIKSNMSFVDEALQEHRRSLDPQLKHYLKNRSYMKALAFLEGQNDIPKGRCSGRTDFS